MIYTVASLAYDERDGILYYTTDNGDLSRPGPPRSADRQDDAAAEGRAHRRAGVQQGRSQSLWGIRHLNGLCTHRPDGGAVHGVDARGDVSVRDVVVRPRRLARRHKGRRGVRRDRRQDGRAGLRGRGAAEGRHHADARFDFGQSVPSSFVFSPDGRFVYGTSYLTGVSNVFRYELATGETEAVSNTETGFFRPIPLGDDQLVVFRFTGQGLRARANHRARRSRTRRRSRFWASGSRRKSRSCGRGSLGSPTDIPWETLPKKRRRVPAGRRAEVRVVLSRLSRATRTRRPSGCAGTCRIACSSIA